MPSTDENFFTFVSLSHTFSKVETRNACYFASTRILQFQICTESKPKRKYIRKSDFKSENNSLVFEGRMLKV